MAAEPEMPQRSLDTELAAKDVTDNQLPQSIYETACSVKQRQQSISDSEGLRAVLLRWSRDDDTVVMNDPSLRSKRLA